MTRTPRRLAALLAALAVTGPLGGCITLLPKQEPVQMYRLTGVADPASEALTGRPSLIDPPRVGVVLAHVELPRAAAGDRLLAVTGQEAAYIAKARWVSPAAVLFEDAVGESFDAFSKRVRLLGRGEAGAASGALRLDVTAFEVRYPAPGATPTAHLEARAVLLRRDGSFGAEQRFGVDTPARENGVAAIVEAMGRATYALGMTISAWTDGRVDDSLAAPSADAPGATTTTTTTRATRTRAPS